MFREPWNRLAGVVGKGIGGALRRLLGDRTGATAIVAALMATSFIGVSGLAVDVGDWFATKRAMQTAADAAAMGGAIYIYQNPTATTAAVTAAVNDGATNLNGFAAGSSIYPVTITTKVTNGGLNSTQTVNVSVSKKANLFLAGVLLGNAPPISVNAEGYVNNGCTTSTCSGGGGSTAAPTVSATASCIGNSCTTTMGNPVTTAVTTSCNNGSGGCGTTTQTPVETIVNNGGVSGNGALTISSGSTITSTGAVVTNTTGNSSGTVTSQLFCGPDGSQGASSGQESKCPGVTESLGMNPPAPDSSGLTYNGQVNCSSTQSCGTTTLSPGVYCGGISISGNASMTLQPGVYVMYNGPFSFTSSGTLDGSQGVTIYFTGTGGTTSQNFYGDGYGHGYHHDYNSCSNYGYGNNYNNNSSTLLNVTPASGGKATITAPTTGTTAGVAVSVDNGSNTSGTSGASSTQMCNGQPMNSSIGGSGKVDVSGVTYLGSHNLTIAGTADVNDNASYTMIEAGNVTVSNTAKVTAKAYNSSSSVPLPSGYTFNVPVVALVK